jgi:hypothetical protein
VEADGNARIEQDLIVRRKLNIKESGLGAFLFFDRSAQLAERYFRL